MANFVVVLFFAVGVGSGRENFFLKTDSLHPGGRKNRENFVKIGVESGKFGVDLSKFDFFLEFKP